MKYLATVHGKPTHKVKELESHEHLKLLEFCHECAKLGYENNKDFAAIKLDKMVLPYGQYHIAIDTEHDKIFSLSGVHHFPQIHDNAYRCLFRCAQLPSYAPMFSTYLFNSGIHFAYMLYEQIKLVQSFNKTAEFFITTNVTDKTGADSYRMNRTIMPRQAKLGIWSLYMENATIYNTLQNVWKINVHEYMRQREEWLTTVNLSDSIHR